MSAETFEFEIARQLAESVNRNGAKQEGAKKPAAGAVSLFKAMSEIESQKVEWLWSNRIPYGRLTIFDGDPEAGKSFLSLKIAATVSTGAMFPGDSRKRTASSVLIISTEDGLADTVRPRLDALGADVSRIIVPNPQRGLAASLMNAAYIESAAKEIGPALVIIDPIVAFTGKRNTDKATEVRDFLSPLMQLAERYAFACILIRHFNKQSGVKALYRGGGSIDFIAACRSAFVIAQNEDGQRVLAHSKNTLGSKAPSLAFSIFEKNGVARLEWGDEVETDADALVSNQSANRGRQRIEIESAKSFLNEALANGARASKDLVDRASSAGISSATLWRAKSEMGVRATKARGNGEWLWRLAE